MGCISRPLTVLGSEVQRNSLQNSGRVKERRRVTRQDVNLTLKQRVPLAVRQLFLSNLLLNLLRSQKSAVEQKPSQIAIMKVMKRIPDQEKREGKAMAPPGRHPLPQPRPQSGLVLLQTPLNPARSINGDVFPAGNNI